MALGFAMADEARPRRGSPDPQVERRRALDAEKGGQSGGMGFAVDPSQDPATVAAATQVVRKAGRHEDDELAHVAQNELLVPVRVQEASPELMTALRQAFTDAGLDMDRYVVADTDGPRNPGTEAEEFYDAGDGSASGGDSADSGDGDAGDGDASDGGGATDGSPAADGTGVAGGGAATGSTGPADTGGDISDVPGRAAAGQYGSAAQAGAVGATVAGGLAGVAMAGMNAAAQGIGSVTGAISEALGGTPSTDGTVGGGVSGGEDAPNAAPAVARQSTAMQPTTRPAGGFGFAGPSVPRINPATGAQQFAGEGNFDRALYLANNSDVAAAGVDPWQHYQQYGQNEGRAANAGEVSARGEGYTGLFGKPESGQTYVGWKSAQSTPAPTPLPTFDPPASASTVNAQVRDIGQNFNSLPGTGTIRNLTMPNGSSIQIREDDPDFARIMAEGGADQGSEKALTYSAAKWYAPGGQGYLDAMRQGHNDPGSDPANPQPFSAASLTAAGVDPAAYQAARATSGSGGSTTSTGGITTMPDMGGTSVESRLNSILASDSPLMQRARTTGNQAANRRGLLNSSIAGEAAQNAMIAAALPIASQDADITNQQVMQGRGILSSETMQGRDITNQQVMQGRNISSSETMQGRDISSRETMQGRDVDHQQYMQGRDIELQRWLQQSDADLRAALQSGELGNQRWIATLDADTRTQIADLQVGTADREKIGAMIAAAQSNYTSQYQAILNNPNIPADERSNNLTHIRNLMNSAISLIEQTYGVDLTWDPATGAVT